ncbi:peptide deformylase [Neorickettsia helminthoeca str. Oregon]|uniref:Peptide deformylase n=2 Tax=Neorickettsia helminthoeca TaxID=33994 RepID=X5HJQ4_9RICK|nr:peptide deformylase [Neorickettsia helminthoeca str. Oregon]
MVSEPVDSVCNETKKFMDDMLETMYESGGIGLAAVQVGVLKRIIVVDISEGKEWRYSPLDHPDYTSCGGPYYMANPEIIEFSENHVLAYEGCLSVPEQKYEVSRPDAITVKYLGYDGKETVLKANGWLGRCIQHEIDHIDGKLFISHLSRLKFDMATKKALKIKRRHLEEDASSEV